MSCFLRTGKHQEDDGERNILKNGEILLRELITSFNGKRNPIRAFCAEELKTATGNYDTGNVIKTDGYYKLYKGFLKDGPISVMTFKGNHKHKIFGSSYAYEKSINSIVFASQMSHKNILKLIGCCLETEIPILVFEFAEYGTLASRIFCPLEHHFEPLQLTHRLKIAMEIANAIAYLHLRFPRPVVSRQIKTSNSVFQEQFVAKLYDFSLSALIPEGEPHIETDMVVGAYGYMAPEYVLHGIINEKIDVFSFGVLLLELLTGKKITNLLQGGPYFAAESEKLMKKYIEEGFNKMVDPIILGEEPYSGKDLQLHVLAELLLKCVSESAEARPTMIDVAKQLRQMFRLS